MALGEPGMGFEQVRDIVLTVRWSRGETLDSLLSDALLATEGIATLY